MKKAVFGRQLGRDKNERRALFRSLISSLVEKNEITTTLQKAKAIRGEVEKLITKAKRDTVADRRVIFRHLGRRDLVDRLVNTIGVVFKDRAGGYLKIVRVSSRKGDDAQLAKIMFTETVIEVEPVKLVEPKDKNVTKTEEKEVKVKEVIKKSANSKAKKTTKK